ncbi:MAG TPA: calcium-binding protein [Thermoleophilaceae bacterium]|jgi:hypothetical protein
MTARFWTNVGRLIALGLLVVALVPATAGAASFQRVGPAPGGGDLAVVKGVPHVAWAAGDGVHVAKLTAGNFWQTVGAPIRHASGAAVSSPSLTSDANGVLWIVWLEKDSDGVDQARVAKFANGSWQEVVGGARPINNQYPRDYGPLGAIEPQIAISNGRPYVAYIQDAPVEYLLEAVRLSDDGTKWEHIPPKFGDRPGHPRLAVSGGHLYLAVTDLFGPGVFVYRLNDAGTGWGDATIIEADARNQFLGDIGDVAGAPVVGFHRRVGDGDTREFGVETLGADGSWSELGAPWGQTIDFSTADRQSVAGDGSTPYVSAISRDVESGPRHVIVARYTGGAWESIDSPSDPAADATSAFLAPGSSGGMWLLFSQSSGGTTTYYLDTLGATLPADGNPNGPPEPPTPPPAGHCANAIQGTSSADRLRGTHLGDSLSGLGGNDTLLAFAGSDCLYGGSGADYLSGAAGNDYLSGGPGGDELRGGDGNDDMNGNSGNDVIVGGRGEDAIDAGSGNDRIYVAAQGADIVDCGPGRDTVYISRIDGVRNCERVVLKR